MKIELDDKQFDKISQTVIKELKKEIWKLRNEVEEQKNTICLLEKKCIHLDNKTVQEIKEQAAFLANLIEDANWSDIYPDFNQ